MKVKVKTRRGVFEVSIQASREVERLRNSDRVIPGGPDSWWDDGAQERMGAWIKRMRDESEN